MMVPGGAQGLFTLLQHGVGTAVMDVIGGEHGDSAMAVLGVVPREERLAEGDGGVDIVESPREADTGPRRRGCGESARVTEVGESVRPAGVRITRDAREDQRCGEGGVLPLATIQPTT